MTASLTLDERLERLVLATEKLTIDAEQREREAEQREREAERREREAERRMREFERKAEREAEQRKLEAEQRKLEAEQRKLEAEQRKLEAEQKTAQREREFAELRESFKKVNDAQKKTDEIIGNLGGRFGVLVELLVIPGVCSVLNEYGHNFNRTTPNFKLKKGAIHTQVDLMLYDTTEAMAVEIKSRLDRNDVRQHLERLKKLRALEEEFFIKGRTLFGAVAAITYDDGSREMARDNGLYIIEIRETEDTLTAEQPEAGKIGKW